MSVSLQCLSLLVQCLFSLCLRVYLFCAAMTVVQWWCLSVMLWLLAIIIALRGVVRVCLHILAFILTALLLSLLELIVYWVIQEVALAYLTWGEPTVVMSGTAAPRFTLSTLLLALRTIFVQWISVYLEYLTVLIATIGAAVRNQVTPYLCTPSTILHLLLSHLAWFFELAAEWLSRMSLRVATAAH
jgi:hypothetical protein